MNTELLSFVQGRTLQVTAGQCNRRCLTPKCVQVYGYCIFKNGEQAKLIYPKEGFEDDVSGRSFTHGRFVQRLRHAAASAPNVTVRQGTVRRLLNGKQLLCTKESSYKPGPACLACWVCDNTARMPLKIVILTLYFIETSKTDTSALE